MKLIVGLGNPGDKYTKTKHNVGFLFLDFFAKNNSFSDYKYESKFKGDISSGNINGEKILLLKPQTFMNLSGESVRKVMDFYKLSLEDIIVIYDDMSMNFSKIRFRGKGSAGGHNGIKNIILHIGDVFPRIKIGIGFNENYEVSDWVLSKFSENELDALNNEIFDSVTKKTQEIL